MPNVPGAGSELTGKPQSPASPATADSARRNGKRIRWFFKKFSKSLFLTIIAAGFLLGAIWMYSSPGELPTPSFATIQLESTFSIGEILYDVSQPSQSITKIAIWVQLPDKVAHTPAKAQAADLWLEVPPGITFETCPPASCRFDPNEKEYTWFQQLDFKYEDRDNGSGEALATFSVKAHSFGYAFNDINASAAVPRVVFSGPTAIVPILYTQYNVTTANSYDWSTFQPQLINASEILWDEPITSAAQGIVAGGINNANVAKDNYETFIAGALIGLAGGAILAAVQEGLHRNDDAATERAMLGALQSVLDARQAPGSERGEPRQEAGEEKT